MIKNARTVQSIHKNAGDNSSLPSASALFTLGSGFGGGSAGSIFATPASSHGVVLKNGQNLKNMLYRYMLLHNDYATLYCISMNSCPSFSFIFTANCLF